MSSLFLLPLSLGIGFLATRFVYVHGKDVRSFPQFRDRLLLLGLGWFPFLLWLINAIWPQN